MRKRGREGRREGGRERKREREKEGGREGGRERRRERGREGDRKSTNTLNSLNSFFCASKENSLTTLQNDCMTR